ncbi:MAG: HD domain-containing protein [Oscillospiraceae bacterium]|nr:HD domain-containing protein [Oscillospiraceae bacterium]
MKTNNKKPAVFDLNSAITTSDDELRMRLDYFADQTDNEIQNHLVAELTARYADVSKQLDDKNEQLRKYSAHLEELVQEKVREISASQIAAIHALVKAAESRDDDTGAHIERTSSFCKLIAEKLYEAGKYTEVIDGAYIENISKASPLHDIGKVGIKDAILLKPDRLNTEEFAIMKTHVNIGYATLASAQAMYPGNVFLKIGTEIAKYHHEKWNGGGYMLGLAGDDIPLSARIMALSDVYDALRSKRVYKEGFSHEKAGDIITEGRGSHFDPAIADIFTAHHTLFEEIYDRLSG